MANTNKAELALNKSDTFPRRFSSLENLRAAGHPVPVLLARVLRGVANADETRRDMRRRRYADLFQ
jgi:hypothetical protein